MRPIRRLANLASLLVLCSLLVPLSASAQAAPPNDDLANATPIGSIPFDAEGDLADATLEESEPSQCEGAERTVWFRFDATSDEDVMASLGGLYGPVLAVFEQGADGSLDPLGCGDYRDGSVTFPFAARTGVSYLLSIGSYNTFDIGYRFSLAHDDLGKIEGSITADGSALATGCATAEIIQEQPDQDTYIARSASARPDGSYHIGALPAGDYTVSFDECAWPRTYLSEWYDDSPSEDLATPIAVEPGVTVQGISADLAPGGVVSGSVTDEAGLPLEGICVNDAVTEADGTYRLTGLPSGPLKIAFGEPACEGSHRYFGEWWMDKPDEGSADTVPVVAGQEVTGVDAALRLGGWITGRVTDGDGLPLSGICTGIPSDEGYGYRVIEVTDESGGYLLAPLETGAYKVRFWECSGGDHLEEWFEDAPDEASATPIPVTVGQGSTADVTLSEGGSIAGTVVGPDGSPLGQVCVAAYTVPPDPDGLPFTWADSTVTADDGTYRFGGLTDGTYLIRYEACFPGHSYMSEWYDDVRGPRDATEIPLDGVEAIVGIDAMLDRPSVLVEESGLTSVVEGGASDTYTIRLEMQPEAPVTVRILTDPQLTVTPSVLTFDASSWSARKTITLRAVDDRVAEGDHTGTITHTVASDDPAFDGVEAPSLTVSIRDNDVPGVRLLHPDGDAQAAEGGGGDAYSLVLDSEPTSDVTIAVDPGGQLSTTPSTVTFTRDDWRFGHSVEITAVDDELPEGPHEGTISHTARSSDPAYDGIEAPDLRVAISDDDATATTLTFDGPSQAPLDSIVRFSAQLLGSDDGAPLPGKILRFELSSGGPVLRSVTGLTDQTGRAEADIDLSGLPRRDYVVRVVFAGDPLTLPSTKTAPFEIVRKATSITLSAPASGRTLEPIDLSATLVGTGGSPMVGREVAFRLIENGREVQEVRATTGSSGTASAALHPIASGDLLITATFPGDDSWMPSTSSLPVAVDRRQPSLEVDPVDVVYEDDPSAAVRLIDQQDGRAVDFVQLSYELTDGAGYSVQTGTVTTNDLGAAKVPVSGAIGPGEYRLSVSFGGTKIWFPAETTTPVSIRRRPIVVATYQGPTSGSRGSTVTMRARVVDGITGEPRPGLELGFRLDPVLRSSSTDADGWAQVSMPLSHEPGYHTLGIAVPASPLFDASAMWVPFQVRWEHTFTSAITGGSVFLNPSTKELQFLSPTGVRSAIKLDPSMQVQTLATGERLVALNFMDAELQLRGIFHLERGAFAAAAVFGGAVYPMARVI